MTELDCRAERCPQPVIATRKLLLEQPGASVTVLVGDDVARQNVGRLAASLGYQVTTEPRNDGFRLQLTPGAGTAAQVANTVAAGKTMVFIAAEQMGDGSDELGRILLRNFLITLTELDPPDAVYFVNAGVKLVAHGSESLEPLEKLRCMGSDIAACGLCLDYFHLKEQVAVGRITNMLDIAQTLLQAGRVIRP